MQKALASRSDHAAAIELFLKQHAMLHAGDISWSAEATFDDQLWQGLDEATARRIPSGAEHSIAWCLWHIARIEDLCINLLAAGRSQVFVEEGWQSRLHIPFTDTGNAQPASDTSLLSQVIDLSALRTYRNAVGARTREIVQILPEEALRARVQPERLQRIWRDGAVLPEGREVVEYWGGRTVAGLLLMPATRHPFIHLNEARRLKALA